MKVKNSGYIYSQLWYIKNRIVLISNRLEYLSYLVIKLSVTVNNLISCCTGHTNNRACNSCFLLSSYIWPIRNPTSVPPPPHLSPVIVWFQQTVVDVAFRIGRVMDRIEGSPTHIVVGLDTGSESYCSNCANTWIGSGRNTTSDYRLIVWGKGRNSSNVSSGADNWHSLFVIEHSGWWWQMVVYRSEIARSPVAVFGLKNIKRNENFLYTKNFCWLSSDQHDMGGKTVIKYFI